MRRNKQKKFNFLKYKRNNNNNIYKANINNTEKQSQAPIQHTDTGKKKWSDLFNKKTSQTNIIREQRSTTYKPPRTSTNREPRNNNDKKINELQAQIDQLKNTNVPTDHHPSGSNLTFERQQDVNEHERQNEKNYQYVPSQGRDGNSQTNPPEIQLEEVMSFITATMETLRKFEKSLKLSKGIN